MQPRVTNSFGEVDARFESSALRFFSFTDRNTALEVTTLQVKGIAIPDGFKGNVGASSIIFPPLGGGRRRGGQSVVRVVL